MAPGNFRDSPKPSCRLRDHAGGALNQRLDHHRGIGISALRSCRKFLLDLADAFPTALAINPSVGALRLRAIEWAPVTIRRHHLVRFESQPRVSPMKQLD